MHEDKNQTQTAVTTPCTQTIVSFTHVIDFPITITKFSITLSITSYVAILNYNYHYFSKVIICNQLQLQITITTSLLFFATNAID